MVKNGVKPVKKNIGRVDFIIPMDEAWILLKRQTTLGEFHPDFPSPYGPVTMRRLHPLESWYEGTDLGQSIPQEDRQPYEKLMQEVNLAVTATNHLT